MSIYKDVEGLDDSFSNVFNVVECTEKKMASL